MEKSFKRFIFVTTKIKSLMDMEEKYTRNRLYVTEEEQEKIKNFRVILGGAGIGSNIAECALRFGFESITIVDGDKVEESNLNRQNYELKDIGRYKAECLAERLLRINPSANIDYHSCFIDKSNVKSIVEGHDVAVNALDFKSDIPFIFDRECCKRGMSVLHPYNFGWGGFLTVVLPGHFPLTQLSANPNGFELKMARYVTGYEQFWNTPRDWFKEIVDKVEAELGTKPLPQLSIGSWISAGFCVNILYNMATGREIKVFPKFYFSSALNDNN